MSSSYDIKCKVMEEELRSVWPEWHVADCLGGSTSSDVFRIYRDNFGIRVESALKVIQVRSEEAAAALPSSGQEAGEAESGETEAASQSDIPDALFSEIQIMEALRGAPNIVAIEDYFFKREGSTCSLFVRMELLTSLQEVLSGRDEHGIQSSIREIIRLGREICTALMHCEKKGIIHRDIKPENLFVDEFGHYKAGDFGTSKRMDTGHIARTMTGIGTISYMAPEIFQGRSCSNTADIYSLGLVLYQLLNKGRMPFLPAEGSYTTQDIDNANFQRLHGISVPGLTGNYVGGERINSRLDAVVRKACASDPADRYQTAKEFYDALEQAETEENKHTPVYRKKTQGSLAPDVSLQNRQQERLQPEPGIKPSADLEPAVSIESLLQESEQSGSDEKVFAIPQPDKTSQSLLQESEQSGSDEKISVIPQPDKTSQSILQESEQLVPEVKAYTAPQPDRASQSLLQKMLKTVLKILIRLAIVASVLIGLVYVIEFRDDYEFKKKQQEYEEEKEEAFSMINYTIPSEFRMLDHDDQGYGVFDYISEENGIAALISLDAWKEDRYTWTLEDHLSGEIGKKEVDLNGIKAQLITDGSVYKYYFRINEYIYKIIYKVDISYAVDSRTYEGMDREDIEANKRFTLREAFIDSISVK